MMANINIFIILFFMPKVSRGPPPHACPALVTHRHQEATLQAKTSMPVIRSTTGMNELTERVNPMPIKTQDINPNPKAALPLGQMQA